MAASTKGRRAAFSGPSEFDRREYGIPGVVGTRDATERIADGTRVSVNGDAGEVTVLE